MPDFEIRAAEPKDIPAILSLVRALAEYEKARPGEVAADEEKLQASLFGPAPAAEALIACLRGEAVGFALFFHNFSTWRGRRGLYLEDLFVRPEASGRGFGKALLVELARIAHRRGCARMEWAVLDWNRPAIEFYKSLGAIPLEEWTLFRLTEDAIARVAGP
jgi:GNAT superfamily N-acetyltransferase